MFDHKDPSARLEGEPNVVGDDFDAVNAYVDTLASAELAAASTEWTELKRRAGGAAALALGKIRIALRAQDTDRALTFAVNFLRMHRAEAARLRGLVDPGAAEIVERAEKIARANAEAISLAKRQEPQTRESTLNELRRLAAREPLCDAWLEHQRLCRRYALLEPAEELFRLFAQRDEGVAGERTRSARRVELAYQTALVAFAAERKERAIALLLEAARAGANLRNLGVSLRHHARTPEQRAEFKGLLQGAPSGGDAEAAAALLVALEAAPAQAISVSPTSEKKEPRDNSPRGIVDSVLRLADDEVKTALRTQSHPSHKKSLFRRICLLVRTGELTEAAKAGETLLKIHGGPEYDSLARQLLSGTPLEALVFEPRPAARPLKDIPAPKRPGSSSAKSRREGGAPGGGRLEAMRQAALAAVRGQRRLKPRELSGFLALADDENLLDTLIRAVKRNSGRAAGLTEVVEQRLRSVHDRKVIPGLFSLYHSMVHLHLLSGKPKRSDVAQADPVRLELERGRREADSSYAQVLANQYLSDGPSANDGRHAWNALIELGDAGYRLAARPEYTQRSTLFRLSAAVEGGRLPPRLALLIVGSSDVKATEAARQVVDAVSRERPVTPILVAVSAGDDPYGLDHYDSVVSVYGAHCVGLDELGGPALISALERAKELGGTIKNPVNDFPDSGNELRDEQLVRRRELVRRLAAELDARPLPVAVYCMRKAGKTATAKLLALAGPCEIVNLSKYSEERLVRDPHEALKDLRRVLPIAPYRAGLLVLDEFDYFVRQLARQPEAIAMDYLNWLRGAAVSARILCLGLDPLPFRKLYPGSNPLPQLGQFRLPYFERDECLELSRKMAGVLKFDDALSEWLYEQCGGHPGVLKGLMLWCIEKRFGQGLSRIPAKHPLRLADIPVQDLHDGYHHARRREVLTTIVSTMAGARGIAEDAWKILRHAVLPFPPVTSRRDIADRANLLDVGLGDHPSQGIDLLYGWGLLREEADGTTRVSIPLLRHHLKHEFKLEGDDEDVRFRSD